MRHRTLRTRYIPLYVFIGSTLGLSISRPAIGQCDPRWLAGDGVPGLNGPVYASTTWDPDGPGPLPPLLIVGGAFSAAGPMPVHNLAAWDGSTWHDVGGGTDNTVRSLATFGGDLIVGGQFYAAGGVWTS